MTSIGYEWIELRNIVKEYVANPLYYSKGLLSFIECFAQLAVDGDNVMNIPEDLLEEI